MIYHFKIRSRILYQTTKSNSLNREKTQNQRINKVFNSSKQEIITSKWHRDHQYLAHWVQCREEVDKVTLLKANTGHKEA